MPHTRSIVTAAAAAAALALPSAALAANPCRAHAADDRIVAQSRTAVVYARGPELHRYNDIARRSLALGANSRTIFWTRAGQPKTATLP